MQAAAALSRAIPCPGALTCAPFGNAERVTNGSSASHTSLLGSSASSSRGLSVTRLAQRENFAELERGVRTVLPSFLRFLPREADEARESKAAATGDVEAVEQGETTVGEVLRAVKDAILEAPLKTAGQIALFGGLAAVGVLISGAVLNSVNRVPLAPEILQSLGAVYSFYIASQVLQKKPVAFPPPSPFRAIIELVEGGQPRMESWRQKLQEEVSEGVAAALEKLERERDTALNEVEELRKNASSITNAVTEKEALEAVALHLAEERDSAMTEVSALQDAVRSITSRIKAIEELLQKEVSQLRGQNQALETVSLQLAAERDAALQEVEQLQSESGQSEAMEALELVASELAQERDHARAEVEELKKVVTILREATSTSSGLTSEQEVFIKARIRDTRAQFIDLEHVYEEQKEAADRFIDHLVEEYGVPREWTRDYIKQFLNSSATKSNPPSFERNVSQVDNLATQKSVTS